MTTKAYLPYLKTLRLIPRDAILDMATRQFNMTDPTSCVCGWAIREHLALSTGVSVEDASAYSGAGYWANVSEMLGGTTNEWADIFNGVTNRVTLPAIEEAFTRRVMECARVSA